MLASYSQLILLKGFKGFTFWRTISKSIDWFLYEGNIGMYWVNFKSEKVFDM